MCVCVCLCLCRVCLGLSLSVFVYWPVYCSVLNRPGLTSACSYLMPIGGRDMGMHTLSGRDRAGEAEGPTQPGSGSSSVAKAGAAATACTERSHMPASRWVARDTRGGCTR